MPVLLKVLLEGGLRPRVALFHSCLFINLKPYLFIRYPNTHSTFELGVYFGNPADTVLVELENQSLLPATPIVRCDWSQLQGAKFSKQRTCILHHNHVAYFIYQLYSRSVVFHGFASNHRASGTGPGYNRSVVTRGPTCRFPWNRCPDSSPV